MIATALIFLLGALTATLIALLFVPLVWRRAQRLARRAFDATIPTSVNEIRAEMDLVRATSAFSLRREERRSADLREQAARERGEAGRVILENGHLLARRKELEETLAERDRRIEQIEERLGAVVAERDELVQARQELRGRLQARADELEAFTLRHRALKERAEEQRQRITLADGRIAQLEDMLRLARTPAPKPDARVADTGRPKPEIAITPPPVRAEGTDPRRSGNERLRAVLKSQPGTGEPETPAPADGNENAEIRERMSDIAARVIQKEIEAEGAQSPLRALIETPEPPRPNGGLSLAQRVRALLADAPTPPGDGPQTEAPTESEAETPAPAAPPIPASSAERPSPGAAKRNGGGRSRPKSRR
ncbi:hypothetical protein [Aureimonas sp. AU20]|uniref:hypothetical protein n=1 Tax=Aureimonas sp. AU20 TaxID=1349819 RepID=UPI0007209989|nr:hypothetical protein [Aureimonas sp. AU20]ALN74011.1 hypothetical protein M673_14890 [Aureimonas sp. AU20]